jgi:tRNA(Phe) wybutosine-synthesizing methylase Tyw3|tara:strand:+ start:950 stop:1201 length:252 start_codon:yes stop_codon:yes gene_type:complete
MKITGNQKVEIEISKSQRHFIAADYICEVFDWDSEYFIEDGWVIKREMCHSSHSFQVNNKVREATKQDCCMYDIFKTLRKQSF